MKSEARSALASMITSLRQGPTSRAFPTESRTRHVARRTRRSAFRKDSRPRRGAPRKELHLQVEKGTPIARNPPWAHLFAFGHGELILDLSVECAQPRFRSPPLSRGWLFSE